MEQAVARTDVFETDSASTNNSLHSSAKPKKPRLKGKMAAASKRLQSFLAGASAPGDLEVMPFASVCVAPLDQRAKDLRTLLDGSCSPLWKDWEPPTSDSSSYASFPFRRTTGVLCPKPQRSQSQPATKQAVEESVRKRDSHLRSYTPTQGRAPITRRHSSAGQTCSQQGKTRWLIEDSARGRGNQRLASMARRHSSAGQIY